MTRIWQMVPVANRRTWSGTRKGQDPRRNILSIQADRSSFRISDAPVAAMASPRRTSACMQARKFCTDSLRASLPRRFAADFTTTSCSTCRECGQSKREKIRDPRRRSGIDQGIEF